MNESRRTFLKAHARAGRHCTGQMLLEALAAAEEAEKVNARLTEALRDCQTVGSVTVWEIAEAAINPDWVPDILVKESP